MGPGRVHQQLNSLHCHIVVIQDHLAEHWQFIGLHRLQAVVIDLIPGQVQVLQVGPVFLA